MLEIVFVFLLFKPVSSKGFRKGILELWHKKTPTELFLCVVAESEKSDKEHSSDKTQRKSLMFFLFFIFFIVNQVLVN